MYGTSPAAPDIDTVGGGTGWLTISGNVMPGEVMELRIAIWDAGDSAFDSLVILDELGQTGLETKFDQALNERDYGDLAGLNIHHDVFFSERTLHGPDGDIARTLAWLRDRGGFPPERLELGCALRLLEPSGSTPPPPRAERILVERGARAALIKGGHLSGPELVDVLHDGRELKEYRRARIDTRSTHGTGCTLSAAVAAGLAHGVPLPAAVESALDYVHRAIAEAPNLGAGNGPLNHFQPVHLPLDAGR